LLELTPLRAHREVGAEGAQRLGVRALASEQRGGGAADGSAVHVEGDAAHHRRHVFLVEARGGAPVARVGAVVQGLEAGGDVVVETARFVVSDIVVQHGVLRESRSMSLDGNRRARGADRRGAIL